MARSASDYERGLRAARREIKTDRWTAETARRYLSMISPRPGDEFDRGYTDAVRQLAEADHARGSRASKAEAEPKVYLSRSEGKYRVIQQGMPISSDRSTAEEALSIARQFKLNVSDRMWDGDTGQWVLLLGKVQGVTPSMWPSRNRAGSSVSGYSSIGSEPRSGAAATSRDVGMVLLSVLNPLMGVGTPHPQMFRVSNGEEPPLAGIGDHVTVTWADVGAEASELDALNAKKSIMLSIEASEWHQVRIARDAIGRTPAAEVTVRAFRGRLQRSFRGRTGTPRQVVAHVLRWFYGHVDASEESRRLARRAAESVGIDLA